MDSKIYIIIVNYKGSEDTIECLESVLKSDYENFQAIIIDNSEDPIFISKLRNWSIGLSNSDTPGHFGEVDAVFFDESEIMVKPIVNNKLIFIRCAKNLGFAAANNIGLRYAFKYDDFNFIWLLNNDTIIQPDSLSQLVKCGTAKDAERIGLWGSKLVFYNNPTILQAVGGLYYKWIGKVKEIGFKEIDTGQYDNGNFKMDYIVGASIFARRHFIAEVGFMDETYFIYYEELDWSEKAKKSNWGLAFCPKSKVHHKMGSSINKDNKGLSLLADYYSVRNRILFAKRFHPYTLLTLYPSFFMFILNRIRLKQYGRIAMFFKIVLNPQKHLRLKK